MGQYMEIQDSRGRRGRRGSSTKSVPGQLEISWWRHSSEFIFIPTKLSWSGDYREFSPSNVIMPLSAGHRGEQKLLIVIPLHYCFGGYTFSFSSSSTLLIRSVSPILGERAKSSLKSRCSVGRLCWCLEPD